MAHGNIITGCYDEKLFFRRGETFYCLKYALLEYWDFIEFFPEKRFRIPGNRKVLEGKKKLRNLSG